MARVNPFSHGASGRSWFYRGYMCFMKQRERQIRCIYKIPQCNLWMPREFFWQNSSKNDCCHYIDLLARKRIADAKTIEESGMAKELVYDNSTPNPEDRPFVNIHPVRLLAMLRGEEVLEVPIDARIRFKPAGGKGSYTSNDVDAAIFGDELTEEYLRTIRRFVGEGRPIIASAMPSEKVLLEKYGFRLIDEKMHSGANLDIARDELNIPATGVEMPVSPAPVAETPVSSIAHPSHTETVSLITGNNQRPYFVRRLLRQQHLLWSGTSYQADGPWTEYHRDQSRLTALNISIA